MKKALLTLLALFFIGNTQAFAYSVMYNVKSGKFHRIWCKWAQKCTQNCILIDKSKAEKRGGVPCKVCGG